MRYSANNGRRGLFDRRELNLKGAQTKDCSSPCPLTNRNKLPWAFWPLHTTMSFLTEPQPISPCDVDQYISTTIKTVEGWSDRSKIILSVWKWRKSAQRIMGVTPCCFLCPQLKNFLYNCCSHEKPYLSYSFSRLLKPISWNYVLYSQNSKHESITSN